MINISLHKMLYTKCWKTCSSSSASILNGYIAYYIICLHINLYANQWWAETHDPLQLLQINSIFSRIVVCFKSSQNNVLIYIYIYKDIKVIKPVSWQPSTIQIGCRTQITSNSSTIKMSTGEIVAVKWICKDHSNCFHLTTAAWLLLVKCHMQSF